MKFTEFDFDERILKGIEKVGFEECTSVQEETFRYTLAGKDVFAQSQTGSGKTAAFLLSAYQLMSREQWPSGKITLVVAPTRELVVQIEKEAKALGTFFDFSVGSLYGGVGYHQQEKMLEEGLDLVVGTPGRLLDFAGSGRLRLDTVGILVIDEADRLFDMGFYPDLRKILEASARGERITMLFSATLNTKVGNLSWEYMNDPGEVVIEPENVTVETVTQELYHVSGKEKFSLLLGIFTKEKPKTAIVFANTRHVAYEVAQRLEHNGFPCYALSGDLPQKQRLHIVEEIKKGGGKYLVATDVAARGLHIEGLQIVVNYDVPIDPESYVHRIGRTARAGESGKAVTLACEKFVYGLSEIEKFLGKKIPVVWAEEGDYVIDRSPHIPPRYRESSRERSRDRTRSPRERQGGGRASDGRGRKPLGPSATRAQQQVLQAAGSYKSREERGDLVEGSPSPRRESSRHAERGRKVTKRGHGAQRNRSERRDVPSLPSRGRRVKSEDSIEKRVDYYSEKYGEDFGAISSTASGREETRSGGERGDAQWKSRRRKGSEKGRERSRKEGLPPSPQKREEPRNRDKSNREEGARVTKKPGLLRRLFGKEN